MNTKNTVCQILPAAIAREELRLRASGEAEKLSRSVSRRTSCGEAYPEYREEVAADYGRQTADGGPECFQGLIFSARSRRWVRACGENACPGCTGARGGHGGPRPR